MHSFKWFLYYLRKPFHSSYHKKIKKLSAKYAQANNSYRLAISEIAEYTNEAKDIVEARCSRLLESISSKCFDDLPQEDLDSFYSQTEHYLYELPLWNARCGRPWAISSHLIPYFKKKDYKKVLDFGGGTGDLCLYLASKGFEMSFIDINEPAVNFAKWLAARRGLNIHFLNGKGPQDELFDCIVTFDVFEHLKNLPEKVKYLVSLLRYGGALIFNIEFSGGGLHIAENKKYQNIKTLDLMLKNSKLRFDNKFKDIYFYTKA